MATQTNKVLNFLRKNAYREYNARTLSRILKIDENKMKVYLNRLHNKGLILRPVKGFYKAIADITVLRQQQLTNPPTLLHGIMMECSIIKYVTKYPPGTPPKRKFVTQKFDKFLLNWLKANEFVFRDDNHSWFRYLWYQQWRITLTITSNAKLCIYIAASKHPLNLYDFNSILLFLDGYLDAIAPFKDRRVTRLKEIALAKDFKELRLDGLKSVSLHAFRNAWTRIYYKDDVEATRFEHHLVLDMPLDDALKSLSILTNPVNYVDQLKGSLDEKRDVT